MTRLCGWCTGPEDAIPKHAGCPGCDCTHDSHDATKEETS